MKKQNIMAQSFCATLIMIFLVMMAGCVSQERKIIGKIAAKDTTITKVVDIAKVAGVARVTPSIPEVRVLPFDFIALDGDYGMNWCEPREDLNWANVDFYKPLITLESPAPCDITLYFWIKEDISFWFDNELGWFYVTIRRGSQNPIDSDIYCPSDCNCLRVPTNSPSGSIGSFWLGCTKKGKVRGNEGKTGRGANVYIEIFSLAGIQGESVNWDYTSDQSPRHYIYCHSTECN